MSCVDVFEISTSEYTVNTTYKINGSVYKNKTSVGKITVFSY